MFAFTTVDWLSSELERSASISSPTTTTTTTVLSDPSPVAMRASWPRAASTGRRSTPRRLKETKLTTTAVDAEAESSLEQPLAIEDLSEEEQRQIRQFQTFFQHTPIMSVWMEPLVAKVKTDQSLFSGRLLDYSLTRHVCERVVRYYLLLPDTPDPCRPLEAEYFETFEELHQAARAQGRTLGWTNWMAFDLLAEYKIMIRRHRKALFDLFRRGKKFVFRYPALSAADHTVDDGGGGSGGGGGGGNDDGGQVVVEKVTTLCQLIFFRWAASFHFFRFWSAHHSELRAICSQEKLERRQARLSSSSSTGETPRRRGGEETDRADEPDEVVTENHAYPYEHRGRPFREVADPRWTLEDLIASSPPTLVQETEDWLSQSVWHQERVV